jgi:hypothetical protein
VNKARRGHTHANKARQGRIHAERCGSDARLRTGLQHLLMKSNVLGTGITRSKLTRPEHTGLEHARPEQSETEYTAFDQTESRRQREQRAVLRRLELQLLSLVAVGFKSSVTLSTRRRRSRGRWKASRFLSACARQRSLGLPSSARSHARALPTSPLMQHICASSSG